MQSEAKKPQADTIRQITPDFRMSDPRIVFVAGKPYLLRICEELVEDRWEGFTSLLPCRESLTIN